MKRAFIVSFVIIFVLSFWILNSSSNQPNSLKQSLLHNGIERDYLLYVPEGLPENAPLVVVAHGYTSSAEIIMAYSGRKRYTPRRERLKNSMRRYRIMFVFALIFVALIVAFNWRSIYDYLLSFTY